METAVSWTLFFQICILIFLLTICAAVLRNNWKDKW